VRELAAHRRIPLERDWQMALAPAGAVRPDENAWLPAGVPGTAAGALRDAGRWSFDDDRDFDAEDAWWRLRFDAAPGPAVLGFDGLATLAEVWLDGAKILDGANMFRAHRVRVELRGGAHELLIRCRALGPELKAKRPRPRWRVPMLVEQQLRWFRTTLLGRTPGWSPPCPAVGPWRPVWLEREAAWIGDARLRARLDGAAGVAELDAEIDPALADAHLVLTRGGERHATPLRRDGESGHAELHIGAPTLWWPHTHGEPALYDAAIKAKLDGQDVRIALGRVGFRCIEIDQANGDFAVRVNGVPVFCRGACWTPLDVATLNAAPDDYRDAVAQMREAGMNMLRIGGTMVYEGDALYDALDEHGVLLWQDLMFANMDYPEDEAFTADALAEVDQQLARLAPHACLALVCGNSEGEQQAAMSGTGRERWAPALFHETLPPHVAAIDAAYVPSSTHGGAFPHAANAGPSSYYGVGAYLRPLDDARRAEVRFASECLAFANVPCDAALPGGLSSRVHHPSWKRRVPRDLGAGWDFDDVRDHYVARLFDVDPTALRVSDHARYLALGRAAVDEVMARTFAEWRRARSSTRGALVWFLRDLWPGAGWGVIDAAGRPKSCWYALKRALAPVAVAFSDEGVNGLVVHVFNDLPQVLRTRLGIDLWRDGDVRSGHGEAEVEVPAHGAIEMPATDLFEGFIDLSWAYRFGPPTAELIHATLGYAEGMPADAFWFPPGLPSAREGDVGLHVEAARESDGLYRITVGTRRFAQSVGIDVPGWLAEDDGFHLAPGQRRTVALRALPDRRPGSARGSVAALNTTAIARFELA
jgi:beta-mannosidase